MCSTSNRCTSSEALQRTCPLLTKPYTLTSVLMHLHLLDARRRARQLPASIQQRNQPQVAAVTAQEDVGLIREAGHCADRVVLRRGQVIQDAALRYAEQLQVPILQHMSTAPKPGALKL